jgi:hypothetical protein
VQCGVVSASLESWEYDLANYEAVHLHWINTFKLFEDSLQPIGAPNTEQVNHERRGLRSGQLLSDS